MALGSTQPLTEMSTRSISLGGKGGRCVRLTTLPPSCAVVTKSGNLNFLEHSKHLGPVVGLIYLFHLDQRCVKCGQLSNFINTKHEDTQFKETINLFAFVQKYPSQYVLLLTTQHTFYINYIYKFCPIKQMRQYFASLQGQVKK